MVSPSLSMRVYLGWGVLCKLQTVALACCLQDAIRGFLKDSILSAGAASHVVEGGQRKQHRQT